MVVLARGRPAVRDGTGRVGERKAGPGQRQIADHTRPRSMCTRRINRGAAPGADDRGATDTDNVYHLDRI
jgi:hypothetical protein